MKCRSNTQTANRSKRKKRNKIPKIHRLCYCTRPLRKFTDKKSGWSCLSCHCRAADTTYYWCNVEEDCVYRKRRGVGYFVCSQCYYEPTSLNLTDDMLSDPDTFLSLKLSANLDLIR